VIAHRLSTIRYADRIVVLEAGQIAQEGSFEALMGAGGPFAELMRRQQVGAGGEAP
jgi:ATP-binding cassette subfamily B protein